MKRIIIVFALLAMMIAGGSAVFAEPSNTVPKPGWDFNSPSGLAVYNERLVVADLGNNQVQILNSDESLRKTLGEKGVSGADNDHFYWPKSVAVDAEGNIYVLDSANTRIQVFDHDGAWIRSIVLSSSSPQSIALDTSGHIFVADANYLIYRLNIDGTNLVNVGASTTGRPLGVALDSEGNVYVSEYSFTIDLTYTFNTVAIYQPNSDGTAYSSVKEINTGASGTDNNHFNTPRGLYVGDGRLYVCDTGNNRVQVFDTSGSYIMTLSRPDFRNVVAVSGDGAGNIYVADGSAKEIFEFDDQGNFVKILGQDIVPTFIGGDTQLTVAQDAAAVDVSSLLHVSDTDADQTLTWTQDTAPLHGTLYISGAAATSGGADIAPGGTITYIPAEGYLGSDSFKIQVDDGNGGTATRRINVTVMERAAAPIADPASGAALPDHSTINLSTASAGAVIYYTTDGSIPTTDSADGTSVTIIGAPGNTVTVKALAAGAYLADSEVVTFTYTIASFSIQAIPDQNLQTLTQGYSHQQPQQIEIANSGTGTLTSLKVGIGGADADAFEITQPSVSTLHTGDPSSSFAVEAKDGLAAGTYSATITISADHMTSENFLITQIVNLPNAPENPRNLGATAGDRFVDLKWDTVTGATYYHVYLSEVSGQYGDTSLATVTDSTYRAGNLTNGTTYYFIVKASNVGGVSGASNQASATPATAPDTPVGVTATAGDGQATVSFTAPDNDGGSAITGYTVTSSPGGKTVTGASSPITVTGLTNGTSYTFTVQAISSAGTSEPSDPSNAVIPQTSGSGTHKSAPPSTPKSSVEVLVNGQAESMGTAESTKENDRTVTTVTVDQQKLADKLASEGQNATVTIPVSDGSDVVIGELNGQMVKNMENKQAILEIKTDHASYTLPAQQINIDAISDQIGKSVDLQDIRIQVKVAVSPADTVQVVENAADKGTFTIVAPPMDFSISASYGDKTVDVSKFNAYVERTIAIPDGVDPNKITTAVVVDSDGTVRHVPTKVVEIDGKYYAQISSLTNSTYTVVWHPVEYQDAANHWAQEAINDMGSRMVITGVGDDQFAPDAEITREAFAASIVHGLGLPPEDGTLPIPDVKLSDEERGTIETAYAYGLVSGFEDGTFRPNDPITREEAMAIIAKAMKLTGLAANIQTGDAAQLLHAFTDGQEVSGWAQDGVADTILAGIVSGRPDGTLAPQDHVTRAEAAVMIRLLLQKSGLI